MNACIYMYRVLWYLQIGCALTAISRFFNIHGHGTRDEQEEFFRVMSSIFLFSNTTK